MNNHSFYMRVLSLLVIVGAVLGYQVMHNEQAKAQEFTDLTKKVEHLENQQKEILTAMQEAAEKKKQQVETAENKTVGVSGQKEEAEVSQEEKEQEEESSEQFFYRDGIYVGEGEGFGGIIQVQMTLENQTITDLQILSAPGEDSAYLSLAQSVMDKILSEQSTQVDTVAGATFSSGGIIHAVNDALGKAEQP